MCGASFEVLVYFCYGVRMGDLEASEFIDNGCDHGNSPPVRP